MYDDKTVIAQKYLPACENLVKLEATPRLAKVFQKATNLRCLYMRGTLHKKLLTNNRHLEVLYVDWISIKIPILFRSYQSVREMRLRVSISFGSDLRATLASFPNLQRLQLIIPNKITIHLNNLVDELSHLTTFKVSVNAKYLKLLRFVPGITSLGLFGVRQFWIWKSSWKITRTCANWSCSAM